MSVATSGKTMELEGTLEAFHLAEILRILASSKMTGILTLVNDNRSVDLMLREGRLVGSATPERQNRLGQLLVHARKLSRKELDEYLLQQQRDPEGRMLGEIMLDAGRITHEEIRELLERQLKEEMWELFSWTEGSFKFENGAVTQVARQPIELEIDPLIEEGGRRMDQWRAIQDKVGKASRVFRAADERLLAGGEPLDPKTWQVLSLIDGQLPIEALICRSGLGKFDTLFAIDDLLARNMIEPVSLPSSPPSVSPLSGGNGARRDASPAARGDAMIARTPGDTGGLRQLFGWRRRRGEAGGEESRTGTPAATAEPHDGGRGAPVDGATPYFSDVGLICDLLNALLDRFPSAPAGTRPGHEANALAAWWREATLRYAKADLVRVCDGRLDPSLYERYLKLSGPRASVLNGCREDALEALGVLGRHVAAGAREQHPDAAEAIRELVAPFFERTVGHSEDFIVSGWTHHWLETSP